MIVPTPYPLAGFCMSANAMIGIRSRDTLQKYESFAVHTKLLPDFFGGKIEKGYFCKIKDEIMETTVFTPAQQVLLRMFEIDNSEETAKEIKKVLADHYQQKLDKEMDKLWASGAINQEKLNELRGKDIHKEMKWCKKDNDK